MIFAITEIAKMRRTRSGVAYHEELAGPDGMSFVLVREADTTDDMLQSAARELHTDRDVVGRIQVAGLEH